MKSLNDWCQEDITNRGYLLKEWDYEKNAGLDPSAVAFTSHKLAFWICPMNHSYSSPIFRRTTGRMSGCRYCAGKAVLVGFNDLASQHPELMDEWDYKKNTEEGLDPRNITCGSHKDAHWICRKCGYSFSQRISCRTGKQKQGCPECTNHVYHSMVGFKNGMLTVIEDLGTQNGIRMVSCRCDCGKIVVRQASAVKTLRSCGCSQKVHDLSAREFSVYLLTNKKNGKKYVGQTVQNPPIRRCRNGRGYNGRMNAAIKKYGWDAFDFEVIEVVTDEEAANKAEQYWISYYKTTDEKYGYNETIGGRLGSLGHKLASEAKEKIGKANRKPVQRFSLDKKFICEYASQSEAAKVLGVRPSQISRACLKHSRSCGSLWKFSDDPDEVFYSGKRLTDRYSGKKDLAIES